VSTILDRFRRGAGVPAAVGDELVSELAPVFAALDEAEAEAERIRATARRRGEERLAEARAQAARIEADASRRAREERERAETERRLAATAELRSLAAAAEEEATRVSAQAGERTRALVEAVLSCVEEAPR
jgi:vacuolar-type H+-ATPase subunit H